MTQLPQHTGELTQIGHYTILSSIGRGGMGLVYLARDTRLDRQVAIKCLRTELIEPHYRERFKREALLLAKLNHPNIVQIYDYIDSDERLALVMEYVDGQNLQQHLREHIVSHAQRMQWLAQIAQGLTVAHDAGIIHRDLKAENILINQHKLAKITDLGIAKSQDFSGTLTDHVTGSYGSMSPEQAMGEELDYRSDLFSFGILAYQLLCGAHPFGETENKLQLMQRIISHPAISPLKKNPDLLPEAVELLGQLLSKDPNNRPDSTHWVAAQCEKLYLLMAANSENLTNSTQILPHVQTDDSGIHKRKKSSGRTQEHPTFETHILKKSVPFSLRAKSYIRNNSITLVFISISITLFASALIWQLYPKQPRYVAVLPPNLTSNGMQESQQELVKGAVYDAIQQSVLQLDGYYLIPRNEIADINAANNKEGIETVRRATAADELISTDIQCKIDACTITLSRLTPEGKTQESRLRVQDTKTVDVLTDNYLSVATTVQSNMGGLYSESVSNQFAQINENEYASFLEVNRSYRDKGATLELLATLDKLNIATKALPAVQTLYSEMTLDINYEKNDPVLLDRLAEVIEKTANKNNNSTYLYNLFYLKIAQKKFTDADQTIEAIKKINPSVSAVNELHAYSMMAQRDYESAITFYKKALSAKETTNAMFYIAMAYWNKNSNNLAKQHLEKALEISPNLNKIQNFLGVISLLEGDAKSAIRSFKKLVEQQANNTMALGNLGLSYMLEGENKKAIELLSIANQLAPLNTTHILNLADAHDLAGDKSKSILLYTQLITTLTSKKTTTEDLVNLSQAQARLGNYSEALRYLQELDKTDSKSLSKSYAAALVHTLAKNYSSAIFNIEAALKGGMGIKWFSFSWFDPLCSENSFRSTMKEFGEPNRCTLQKTTTNHLTMDDQYPH